jgi:molybdate transport system substrate-binding protein
MRLHRIILPLLLSATACADTITVAVASNFSVAASGLVVRFEQLTGHHVRVATASTGLLYAQASNGAPFSAFLAADADRPRLLQESGVGIAGSRFTYAIGRLVLWSADPALSGADCRDQLDNLERMRLAIANPLTAPYGEAAKQFLMRADIWDDTEDNLVYGENIAQTFQFVATRNANMGLIAASQLIGDRVPATACEWTVPDSMHEPIEQQAILLDETDAARAFLEFLASSEGRAIIRAHGYEVPD